MNRPNKYNDARRLIGKLGIRPPNYLAGTVYNYLKHYGYEWRQKMWVKTTTSNS